MCKHEIRSMVKPNYINVIGMWELIYWPIVCGLVLVWWWKLDRGQIFEDLTDEYGFYHPNLYSLYNTAIYHWDFGLYIHCILCILFVPAAVLLLLGMQMDSRCLIVTWMVLSTIIALARIATFVIFYQAYQWLRWWEVYWILRIYFLLCAGHYCLDLWGGFAEAEQVIHPYMLPDIEEDPREWRGGLNYPQYRLTSDIRPKVFGWGRHLPMNMIPVGSFPTWYEAVGEDNTTRLVVDSAAYEAL